MNEEFRKQMEEQGYILGPKMSSMHDGQDCHPSLGRHYHCAECEEPTGMYGHYLDGAFTCQEDS